MACSSPSAEPSLRPRRQGRRLVAAAAVALLVAATPARGAAAVGEAPRLLSFGGGVGLLLRADADPWTGDGPGLFEGLGGDVTESELLAAELELREVIPLVGRLALDLREAFSWTTFSARFAATPELDARLARYTVALAAGLQVRLGRDSASLALSAAPALVVVVTETDGWLGTDTSADAAPGGVFTIGGWFGLTESFALSVEQSLWLVRVPQASRLLADGGTDASFALTLGAHWRP